MCGIAGIAFADPRRAVELPRLEAMSAAIHHRGPDGVGYHCEPGVGLAHRRLSIIDLEGGRQPLSNEDETVHVLFNGEIYNYRELRDQLERRGHRFATHSDTEVLVHLYEDHGPQLVDKLRGMFAFAIWDSRSSRLTLSRDRLGIKPLYYLRDNEKLLFGSELKAILAYGGVAREVDPVALETYLAYGMVTGARTIFRGIERLLPGHTLVVEPGAWLASPRRYWRLEFAPDDSRTPEQWCDEIRSKLDETVNRHLIADVPVGSFLSGGIDSSVITALASRHTDQSLQTFSIGFSDSAFNELPYARLVATHYDTQHREEVVTADAAAMLDELCWHYDEPFADTSAIPTLMVARLASQHVKVVLSGDGGDEAFGGYARYVHDLKESALRQRLPAWFRHSVLARAASAWPKADWLPRWLRAKTLLTNLSLEDAAAYANTIAQCRLPLRRRLLSRDVKRELNGSHLEIPILTAFAAGDRDPLASMIAADVETLLPDDYLVKVDRASMAYGLEVRPPLLDHELLELSARIPSSLKIRNGETKWIFKQACGDLLPSGLLKRPKQGFETPVDSWLRGELRDMFHDLVLDSAGPIAALIDLAQARRAFELHCQGRARLGQTLWALMVLARWSEMFVGSAVPSFTRPQPALA